MKTKIFSAAIVFFMLSYAAQSQSYWNERNYQGFQRERIKEGRRSGELTPHEFRHLNKEQRKMHRTKMRMLRDGRLDRCEKQRLHKMKKHSSRHIWREKHDGQRKRSR